MLNRKTQSIVEYVLLLSVVIGALITALDKYFKPKIEKMIADAANVISTQTDQFKEKACGGAPTN